MRTLPCAECKKDVAVDMIKYHTADKRNIFCGPQCSLDWYTREREKNEQER